MKMRFSVWKLLSVAALALFLLWTVVPILLVLTNAFKTPLEIKKIPPVLFFKPTMTNFVKAFSVGDFGLYFKNSFVIALITTLISVVGGAMGGYGLSLTGGAGAGWFQT